MENDLPEIRKNKLHNYHRMVNKAAKNETKWYISSEIKGILGGERQLVHKIISENEKREQY